MPTTTRPFGSLWTTVRTQLRDARERAALARELASYDTPAELNDLYAILDRYSEEETADLRRILAAQQNRWHSALREAARG